jgi:AcrR family transcriptional regulator
VQSPHRTKGPTRTDRRRRITDSLLIEVEQILDGGETYADISVERLISAIGISRSTFYVYYEDKGALLLALAEDVVDQLVVAAGAWWSLPHDVDRPMLQQTLQGIFDTYARHASMWAALIDGAAYDPKVRASFRQVVDGSAAGLAEHIRAGQALGCVRRELDPVHTAAWLTWMTERGLYQLLPDADEAESARLCKAHTAIVWHKLYGRDQDDAAA